MNDIEIGISTASLFGLDYTENNLKKLKELGTKTCEVFLCTFYEYTKEFAKILQDNQGGLNVHSVHAMNTQFEPQLFNVYSRTVFDAQKILRDVCCVAKALNAKYLTFHGPTSLKHVKMVYDFDFLSKRLNEVIDICLEYGVTLQYENVHWCYSANTDYFNEMFKFIPNLNTCLDIKQARQSKIDYKEFLKVMKGHLTTVHVCDYDQNDNLKLPGHGVFNFKDLFRRLIDDGYNGPIMLEAYAKTYNSIDQLEYAFQFLKNELEIAKKG